MKKLYAVLVLFFLITACGVKTTQTMISEGNYDNAIDRALESLKTNKNSKGKQDYVYLLEEAFAKAKQRDLELLNVYIKEGYPSNYEKIYNTYLQLHNRQERIRPVLPLTLIKERRNAIFPFDDYSQDIVDSKNKLCKHLYENSKGLLLTKDKINFRRAFDDLSYIENLIPNYQDTRNLITQAQNKGTDFVFVSSHNETNMVIPKQLENDILDINTYGLNDKWTVYHNKKQNDLIYDYGLVINFRQINISPEQIKEREFIKEKQIKNGTKPYLDSNGKQVKDEKGNIIMVDNLENVRVNIYEFKQLKACQVTAKIDYLNFKNGQLLQTFPIVSEFVFENIYANYKGDKRAADDNYMSVFNKRPMPFPSNEQMVADTSNDLKNKLKNIIVQNKFR